MSLRTRLLLAFATIVFIPIALLAFGLRREMTNRLSDEYQRRLATVVERISEDLRLESAGIGERLASLKTALLNDNHFRLGAIAGLESERAYLRDYAGTAMRLTGLSMLQIQDGDGRIISSGHFRNEHGSVEPGLAAALADARRANAGVALVTAHGAERDFLALARDESLNIGDRTFTLIGGTVVDEVFLGRLARDRTILVSLVYPGGALSSENPGNLGNSGNLANPDKDQAVGDLKIPLIRSAAGAPIDVVQATLRVAQPLTPLRTLLRNTDSWFLAVATLTGLTALVLAVWVSSRISRPLATLAEKTAVLDLDRLDVDFDEGRTDEVGTLSRLLGDLATRLRSSTARVREAERRATVGELARQINHDIKNGLIPLRNVIRHLEQVGRDSPAALSSVLAERRQTVDSSIAYLETLATNYERLSPAPDRRDCDLNAVVSDVVLGAHGQHVDLHTRLAANLPRVVGDPVALRRILENLIANAVDSLNGKPGRITISTEPFTTNGEPPAIRVTVADTGCGMSKEEAGKIFNDFYTTKEGGTGLGLSIVRRLVMDLHGTLRVESEPGAGTRMIIDFPSANRDL